MKKKMVFSFQRFF